MKKKKVFILGFLLVFLSILLLSFNAEVVEASVLKYKPNVPIPIEVGGYNFAEENVIKGGDFLASYIVAIYSYGAGFAGIIAMFMLVIAGWKWLMAGGNAQKIQESKTMVSGVLVGLALLFGGQLLLRQISEDFAYIQPLDVTLPTVVLESVTGTYCETIKPKQKYEAPWPGYKPPQLEMTCEDYDNAQACAYDICDASGRPASSKDPSDRCVPQYADNGGGYQGCVVCPNSGESCDCSATFYVDLFIKNLDPCDCDGDKKFPDDKCEIL